MLNKKFLDQYDPIINERDRLFYQVLIVLTLAAILISFVVSIVLVVVKVTQTTAIYTISVCLIYILLYFISRGGSIKAGFYGLIYLTCLAGIMGMVMFGWKSGVYLYLFVIMPVIFFNNSLKKNEMIGISLVYSITLLFLIFLSFAIPPIIGFNSFQLQVLNISNTLLSGLALGGISHLDNRNAKRIANRLIEANEKLSYQASRDSLTNLINRRRMNELIEMEHIRSMRSAKPFGLIMADIDDFKQVNDAFGHAAGDFVLIQLAHLLSTTLRKQDLIARWGGEEFLILLPETDLNGVQVTAEKLRQVVSQSSFSYQGSLIQVTISFGSVVCEPGDDWDQSIKNADGALYYGKNHGKNLSVYADKGTYLVTRSSNI
ncbi:MAG: hypothetical protein C0401_07970 [Anaerolinea sp.]|nr:hypothetical protein [Anaerolinea sp.]